MPVVDVGIPTGFRVIDSDLRKVGTLYILFAKFSYAFNEDISVFILFQMRYLVLFFS